MNAFDLSLEIKSIGPREFEGHGSIFRNVDHGGDIVAPGAFKQSLARHEAAGTRPLMFWMHQPDQVPGVWHDVREDKDGLYVRGELVETQLGRDVHTLLTKKAVRGLSIGYRPEEVGYDPDGNRILKQIDLWEVSIVSMAMNPLARVEAAKARLSGHGEYVPTVREFEHRLREWGCSKTVARTMIARLFDEAPGGMPGHWRDAGGADDDAQAVLERLARLTDNVGAAALKRY